MTFAALVMIRIMVKMFEMIKTIVITIKTFSMIILLVLLRSRRTIYFLFYSGLGYVLDDDCGCLVCLFAVIGMMICLMFDTIGDRPSTLRLSDKFSASYKTIDHSLRDYHNHDDN
jgi:hypothetical protein